MKKIILILTIGMILTGFSGYVFAWDPNSSPWDSGSSWGSPWGGSSYDDRFRWSRDPYDRGEPFDPYNPPRGSISEEWPKYNERMYPNPERQLRYETCIDRCNRVPVQDAIDCMEACNAMFGP